MEYRGLFFRKQRRRGHRIPRGLLAFFALFGVLTLLFLVTALPASAKSFGAQLPELHDTEGLVTDSDGVIDGNPDGSAGGDTPDVSGSDGITSSEDSDSDGVPDNSESDSGSGSSESSSETTPDTTTSAPETDAMEDDNNIGAWIAGIVICILIVAIIVLIIWWASSSKKKH